MVFTQKGFSLVELLLGALILGVLSLGTASFFANQNKGMLALRASTSRDALQAELNRYSFDPRAIQASANFVGDGVFPTNATTAINYCVNGAATCGSPPNCCISISGGTPVDHDITLTDPSGVAVAGPGAGNPKRYDNSGNPCAGPASPACPFIAYTTMQAICAGGAASCSVATSINITYTLKQDPSITSGLALKLKDVSGGASVSIPLSATFSGVTNFLAKWSSPTSLQASGVFEDNIGNLGIGITTPSQKLHVVGNAGQNTPVIAQSVTGFSLIDYPNTGAVVGSVQAGSRNGNFVINTAGNERLRIEPGGNVGIGTAPATNLHVGGATGVEVRMTSVTPALNGRIFVGNLGGIDRMVLGPTSNHDLGIQTNNATQMTLKTSGNLGIGTLNPSQRLHVVSQSAQNVTIVSESQTAFSLTDYPNTGVAAGNVQAGSRNGNFVINTSGTERMRIESGGNVGIGVNNPTQSLHILAQSGQNVALVAQSQTAFSLTDYPNTGVPAGNVQAGSRNGNFVINTSGTERVRIESGGNVGIGVTNPAEKLEVNGGIKPGSATVNAACSNEGTFAYDFAAHAPVFCSNTGVWKKIGGGGVQGLYQTGFNGCLFVNPYTGACSCPPGTSPAQVGLFYLNGFWNVIADPLWGCF